MTRSLVLLSIFLMLAAGSGAQKRMAVPVVAHPATAYLGFDRNDYPGDENLATLRKTFWYTSYWLNPPPGTKATSWLGKRKALQTAGFGFLVVFNGRLYDQLKAVRDVAGLGEQDAHTAIRIARQEGFPPGTIIFLDQEQGGRQLPEQKTYIYAFVDAVNRSGFRAGVYCSGIPFRESGGKSIVTAEDIRRYAGPRQIAFWISNDACAPSPGCSFPAHPPAPADSGVAFADVWQYAQSPRRPAYTASCKNTYAPDGDCYAPGLRQKQVHIDVNTATSSDPSHGRTE